MKKMFSSKIYKIYTYCRKEKNFSYLFLNGNGGTWEDLGRILMTAEFSSYGAFTVSNLK